MNPLALAHPASIALVALGGAIGSVMRHMAVSQVARMNPTYFPLGTMLVNIVGSLFIGAILARYGHESSVRAFIVTGMIGGFTTFSAFSWDALQLVQRGHYIDALLYIGGSVILSLAGVSFGYMIIKAV